MNILKNNSTPDILDCIADLSNDEIFTSPKLANNILDTLPKDLWSNPDIKFLDPTCKTGVFLREIAKRLNSGLRQKIKDHKKRTNHIFTKQIFGISITEITSASVGSSRYVTSPIDSKTSLRPLMCFTGVITNIL